MWPCRDTMKHISHLGWCPLEGLALVSGGYHDALVPLFGISARLGNNPPICSANTERLLTGAPWIPSILLFFVLLILFDPCRCSKLSFVGQRSVTKQSPWSMQRFIALLKDTSSRCQHVSSNWRTVSLHAASHHSHSPRMTWQNMRSNIAQYVSPAAIPVHRIRYTFWENISSVAFTSNYRW